MSPLKRQMLSLGFRISGSHCFPFGETRNEEERFKYAKSILSFTPFGEILDLSTQSVQI